MTITLTEKNLKEIVAGAFKVSPEDITFYIEEGTDYPYRGQQYYLHTIISTKADLEKLINSIKE